MALGCMSITAFAAENETNITAEITAADFGYTMVIPTTTTLTEANHENVLLGTDGKVSITNIKHPTDKVNVSYTVDLTNGNLTDGTNTITTSYTYAQGGDYSALTADTKVTVYTGGQVVDSTIKVTADDTEWMAAPSGDYTASVVFNFGTEEKTAKVIIADILPDNFPTDAFSSNWSNNMACNLWVADGNLNAKGGWEKSVPVSTELTLVGDKYTCTTATDVWTFTMDGESFCKATISDSTVDFELNGDYTQAK